MASTKFNFYPMGIGQLLKQGPLQVPANQRSYAWRDKHVENLLQDLNEAINSAADDYFLGTIVLIQPPGSVPSIVDGQQRLATTAIIFARIRDYFLSMKREGSARGIEDQYLGEIDINTEALVSRIKLNDEDNEFFSKSILARPNAVATIPAKDNLPKRRSNRRLARASDIVKSYLADVIKPLPADRRPDLLVKWVDFINLRASVLAVYVPDEDSAFRMFETLNDRGLRASQTDILKNYFFSRAGNRLSESKLMWSTIAVTIEPLAGDKDSDDDDETEVKNDPLLTYLRHLWIITHGRTKAGELAAQIRLEITNETKTITFLSTAAEAAQDYIALSSPQHPKWASYKATTKQYVYTIAEHLKVTQIKPLLFSVARHFNPVEADKAFRLFVTWSVRFLIYGGRGGMLDTQYSLRAKEVGTKQITKARELREAMRKYVPTDAEFEEAFSGARVSRAYLARYYLRAIEKTRKADPQPEYVANEDVADINLEHVMPLDPPSEWEVDPEIAEASQTLLGNMVLLRANQNRDLGRNTFDKKRALYKTSGYLITRDVSQYENWTLTEIQQRQNQLAKLAVKTWSLDFTD